MRTTGENSIFLPKMKQFSAKLFVFVWLTSDYVAFAYLSTSTIGFSNVLFLETTRCISNSFSYSSRKRCRLLISLLNKMLNLHCKINLPKNRNQLDSLQWLAICYIFVLKDYTTFMTSKNLNHEMFTMRWKWSTCLSDVADVKLFR